MKLFASTLIVVACLAQTACEKHQEPIGSVPADDVPAVPASGASGREAAGDAGDASACAREAGAEREACLRRYPPATATQVEPQRNSPPPPVD